MAAQRHDPDGGEDALAAQQSPSVEKRKRRDRRAAGRRIDERRKFGFGEIIPERRMGPRRGDERRARKRRY